MIHVLLTSSHRYSLPGRGIAAEAKRNYIASREYGFQQILKVKGRFFL
jgi:hypothetical protein